MFVIESRASMVALPHYTMTSRALASLRKQPLLWHFVVFDMWSSSYSTYGTDEIWRWAGEKRWWNTWEWTRHTNPMCSPEPTVDWVSTYINEEICSGWELVWGSHYPREHQKSVTNPKSLMTRLGVWGRKNSSRELSHLQKSRFLLSVSLSLSFSLSIIYILDVEYSNWQSVKLSFRIIIDKHCGVIPDAEDECTLIDVIRDAIRTLTRHTCQVKRQYSWHMRHIYCD